MSINRELFNKQLGYDLAVGGATAIGTIWLTSLLAGLPFRQSARIGLMVLLLHAATSAIVGFILKYKHASSRGTGTDS